MVFWNGNGVCNVSVYLISVYWYDYKHNFDWNLSFVNTKSNYYYYSLRTNKLNYASLIYIYQTFDSG